MDLEKALKEIERVDLSKTGRQNFAYIDGANLHKGIGDLGWKLDYHRFRVWLDMLN